MEFLLASALTCNINYLDITNVVCKKWTEKASNGATIYKVQMFNSKKEDIRTVNRCSYLGAKRRLVYKEQVEDKWCKHEP